MLIVNDITERKEMEQQLLIQATHDALTGLPNRVLLLDRVEQAVIQSSKNKSKFAFIFIDLDRFKMTNDTLGHGMGDKLLQAIANRLLLTTHDYDTVARFGGDEFVVLLPEIKNEADAEMMVEEMLVHIQKPVKIGQHQIKITASAGISFFPKDGEDYEGLMKNADLSMYHAKDSGRNTYRVFDVEMNRRIINYALIDTEMRMALKRKEFYLSYQPIVHLTDGSIAGFEALLRWKNPKLGHVSPVDFIPIAEENHLILDIGAWVLEEACGQLKKWQTKGFKHLTMAVNISGIQLHHSNLIESIQAVLKKTGIRSENLELEPTESLLIENIETVIEQLLHLKDLGINLSIDDFGTGYSSLSYLKQFPVNKLKIDRSFIQEISQDQNSEAIVKAIINLGNSLELKVLAEGIETLQQQDFIKKNGCQLAQGYFYSPPIQVKECEKFIKERSSKK